MDKLRPRAEVIRTGLLQECRRLQQAGAYLGDGQALADRLATMAEERLRRESAEVQFHRLPANGFVTVHADDPVLREEAVQVIRENTPDGTTILPLPGSTRVVVHTTPLHGVCVGTGFSPEEADRTARALRAVSIPPGAQVAIVWLPAGATLDMCSDTELAAAGFRRTRP